MNIRKYLPFEDYVLESRLTAEEVQRRVFDSTGSEVRWLGNVIGRATDGKPYFGVVDTNTFTIRRMLVTRNSFAPVIKGVISSVNGRTRIHVKMHLSTNVRIFLFFWFGLLAIVCAGITLTMLRSFPGRSKLSFPSALIPFVMFIGGCVAIPVFFKKESKISMVFLKDLVSGVESNQIR